MLTIKRHSYCKARQKDKRTFKIIVGKLQNEKSSGQHGGKDKRNGKSEG